MKAHLAVAILLLLAACSEAPKGETDPVSGPQIAALQARVDALEIANKELDTRELILESNASAVPAAAAPSHEEKWILWEIVTSGAFGFRAIPAPLDAFASQEACKSAGAKYSERQSSHEDANNFTTTENGVQHGHTLRCLPTSVDPRDPKS